MHFALFLLQPRVAGGGAAAGRLSVRRNRGGGVRAVVALSGVPGAEDNSCCCTVYCGTEIILNKHRRPPLSGQRTRTGTRTSGANHKHKSYVSTLKMATYKQGCGSV